MAAGDGLLVRVRPRFARLSQAQVEGLCAGALHHGNGLIDLTNRANLQIRGVAEAGLSPLLESLVALELVDADPAMEARRAILVTPDWQVGDDTHRIAEALAARLGELPDLSPKIGFAVDAGTAPMLGDCPADFRIERGMSGGLILRADGRDHGVPVTVEDAADAIIALTHWFVESGGPAAGRMARHHAPLPEPATERPAPSRAPLRAGNHALGAVASIAFGSISARELTTLFDAGGATALRISPWRQLLLESASADEMPATAGPMLRIDACPGAPACPQATVETRALATRLMPLVGQELHISGCAKGCARQSPAPVMLTGRDGRYDLAFDACADAPPTWSSLSAAQILAHFGAS